MASQFRKIFLICISVPFLATLNQLGSESPSRESSLYYFFSSECIPYRQVFFHTPKFSPEDLKKKILQHFSTNQLKIPKKPCTTEFSYVPPRAESVL
jgi:hypothetical protein